MDFISCAVLTVATPATDFANPSQTQHKMDSTWDLNTAVTIWVAMAAGLH